MSAPVRPIFAPAAVGSRHRWVGGIHDGEVGVVVAVDGPVARLRTGEDEQQFHVRTLTDPAYFEQVAAAGEGAHCDARQDAGCPHCERPAPRAMGFPRFASAAAWLEPVGAPDGFEIHRGGVTLTLSRAEAAAVAEWMGEWAAAQTAPGLAVGSEATMVHQDKWDQYTPMGTVRIVGETPSEWIDDRGERWNKQELELRDAATGGKRHLMTPREWQALNTAALAARRGRGT